MRFLRKEGETMDDRGNIITIAILAGLMLCSVVWLLSNAEPVPTTPEQKELQQDREANRRQEQRNNLATFLVVDLDYIKDPRTQICFAHYDRGDDFSVTMVPCERIPPHLLGTANVK